MIRVELARADFGDVARVGFLRSKNAILGNYADPSRAAIGHSWIKNLSDHVNGYAGELVWSRYTGQPINDPLRGFRREPDVGERDEVRTTRLWGGGLVIYRGDDLTQRFVLIVGEAPIFGLVGIFDGAERELERRWFRHLNPRRPAVYCIPQEELKPL